MKILSGDSEHYPIAIYKAIVMNAYKGTTNGQIIFFGPFVSYGVGSEYVVFLKNGKSVTPTSSGSLSYGSIPIVGTVMYDGYSALEVGYECVFEGQDIAQQCDYSVQLNPEQIILPEGAQLFPKGDATPITNYKKWIRKAEFLGLLHS